MSVHIGACSLWEGDEPATRIETGVVRDPAKGPYYEVVLQSDTLARADLPVDLTDWAIHISTEDDRTIASEVTDCDVGAGTVTLTVPDPEGVALYP